MGILQAAAKKELKSTPALAASGIRIYGAGNLQQPYHSACHDEHPVLVVKQNWYKKPCLSG
jgi:hypothetical protein